MGNGDIREWQLVMECSHFWEKPGNGVMLMRGLSKRVHLAGSARLPQVSRLKKYYFSQSFLCGVVLVHCSGHLDGRSKWTRSTPLRKQPPAIRIATSGFRTVFLQCCWSSLVAAV